MAEFTYRPPNNNDYLKTLLEFLEYHKEDEILELLNKSKCEIIDTGSFSRRRWNGMRTVIHFFIPIRKLRNVNPEIEDKLIHYCNELMPKNVGFDVMEVDFSPLLFEKEREINPIENVETSIQEISEATIKQILPDDIKKKGTFMAKTYLYLYCIENSLRLFIDKILREVLGNEYFKKIKISSDVRNKIKSRKENEEKNKWLRIRGDLDIFYLDFSDIGKIISNNWELFKNYFPNQQWISAKIEELSECRNLVAHNSYLEKHHVDLLVVYYESILRQIDMSFKKT